MPNNLPQVIVAQLGARMHYAVPVLLHRAGMLAHCYTDAYVGRGSSWHWPARAAGLLPESWRPAGLRRLLARRGNGLPPHKVTAFNIFGLRFAQALNHAYTLADREKIFLTYGEKYGELVAAQSWHHAQAAYTFHGPARAIMQAAKRKGLLTIYEKFSAPKKIEYQLFSKEHDRWPGWEPPYPQEKIFLTRYKLEQEEWEAADAILCPSDFVIRSMLASGVPAGRLRLVPYGIEVASYGQSREPWDGIRPLRLLFVGGVTLRKGVQYLYQALQKLVGLPLEARAVGGVAIQEPYRSRLNHSVQLTGLVPRPEVVRHYDWADLFVFPTICDSFGMVQIEALASGLPVITTPNAGSVVREGIDGFIVPIRDAEALAEKIELLAKNPELLVWMSHNARERAQDFSWEKYRERLVETIRGVL